MTSNVFFDEFSSYLESIVMSSDLLSMTGDFNSYVDVPENPSGVCFLELLESVGLQQHVRTTPAHEPGHTLDLIITRQRDSLPSGVPVSDYFYAILQWVNRLFRLNQYLTGKLKLLLVFSVTPFKIAQNEK